MSHTKSCKGCGNLLPVDSFYRHNRMADGRLNFCVECVKRRINEHRAENLERIQQYDRRRASLPERQSHLVDLRRRHRSDPVRARATGLTTYAIKTGRLVRPSQCSECLHQCKPEAHHDDYSKPLDVRWLCRSCHCRFHRLQFLASQSRRPDA